MAKELSLKQKLFADAYLKTGNAYQSAIEAGYSAKYANASPHKLLGNVGIQNYISERMKELESTRIADIKEVKEFWSNVFRSGNVEMKDRLKASEYLAKSGGAFLDRVEATVQMVTFEGESDMLD